MQLFFIVVRCYTILPTLDVVQRWNYGGRWNSVCSSIVAQLIRKKSMTWANMLNSQILIACKIICHSFIFIKILNYVMHDVPLSLAG